MLTATITRWRLTEPTGNISQEEGMALAAKGPTQVSGRSLFTKRRKIIAEEWARDNKGAEDWMASPELMNRSASVNGLTSQNNNLGVCPPGKEQGPYPGNNYNNPYDNNNRTPFITPITPINDLHDPCQSLVDINEC